MIRQLLDRRVPQFVGLYLVGSWGFLEFLDWAVSRYFLSPALIDFTVALLLLRGADADAAYVPAQEARALRESLRDT